MTAAVIGSRMIHAQLHGLANATDQRSDEGRFDDSEPWRRRAFSYAYVLRAINEPNRIYIGWTNDLRQRSGGPNDPQISQIRTDFALAKRGQIRSC